MLRNILSVFLLVALCAPVFSFAQTTVDLPTNTGGSTRVDTTVGNNTDVRVTTNRNGTRVGVNMDHDDGYKGIITRGVEGAIDEAGRGGDNIGERAGYGVSRGIRNLDANTTAGKVSRDVAAKVVRDLANGNTGDLGSSALEQAARSGRGPFVNQCRSTIRSNSGGDGSLASALSSSCSCAYSAAQYGDSNRAQRCFERAAFNILEDGINSLINSAVNGGQTCLFGFCFGGGGGGGDVPTGADNAPTYQAMREVGTQRRANVPAAPYRNLEKRVATQAPNISAPNVPEEDYLSVPTEEEQQEITARRERYMGASLKHGYLATLSADDEETEAAYVEALLNTPKAKMALTGTYLSPAMRATAESLKAEAQQDYQNLLIREQTVELAAGMGVQDARAVRSQINTCIADHIGSGSATASSYAQAYYACSGAADGDGYDSFDGFDTAYLNNSGGGASLGGGGGGATLRSIASDHPNDVNMSASGFTNFLMAYDEGVLAEAVQDRVIANGSPMPPEHAMPALAVVDQTGRMGEVLGAPLPAQTSYDILKRYYQALGAGLAESTMNLYNFMLGNGSPAQARQSVNAFLLGLEVSGVASDGLGSWVEGYSESCSMGSPLTGPYLAELSDRLTDEITEIDPDVADTAVERIVAPIQATEGFRPAAQMAEGSGDSGEGGVSVVLSIQGSAVALLETAVDCNISGLAELMPTYYMNAAENTFFTSRGILDEGAVYRHACEASGAAAQSVMRQVLDYYTERLNRLEDRISSADDSLESGPLLDRVRATLATIEEKKQTVNADDPAAGCSGGETVLPGLGMDGSLF